MAKKTNQYVKQQIGGNWRLLDHCDRLKLRYFGHMIRAEGFEFNLLTAMVEGRRKQGRQKTRLVDGVMRLTGLLVVEVVRAATLGQIEWFESGVLETQLKKLYGCSHV